ncbi:hypothetical protein ACQ86N_39165 [Puia sp. P3]|uniref:hypothetical protein n=1 Tax=Puia sp. P3 TaxID=3423952 RepID=UPI003D678B4A
MERAGAPRRYAAVDRRLLYSRSQGIYEPIAVGLGKDKFRGLCDLSVGCVVQGYRSSIGQCQQDLVVAF